MSVSPILVDLVGAVRLLQNRHILFMIYYVSLKPIKPEIRPSLSQSRGQHFKFLAVAPSESCNKASSIPLCHIVLMDGTVPAATQFLSEGDKRYHCHPSDKHFLLVCSTVTE